MQPSFSTRRGFTLVELLVVIAIIAVLATLAAPALLNVLKKGKITKAANICHTLELAVDNFEQEYSYLPYVGDTPPANDTSVRSDTDIMTILAGIDSEHNPKKIRFFETDTPKGSNESTYADGMHVSNTAAKLYDPWGEPYYLVFDYDLDGEIENPLEEGKIVRAKRVLVYSLGPDKKSSTKDEKKDNAKNF